MDRYHGPTWFEKLGRTSWLFVGLSAAVLIIATFLGQFSSILTPLVLAFIIAIGFSPAVAWLHKRGLSRSLSAILVVLAIGLMLVGTMYLVVNGLANNADQLTANLAKAGERVADAIDNPTLQEDLNNLDEGFQELITSNLSTGVVGNAVNSVVGVFTGLFIGTMLLYYLLRDGEEIILNIVSRRQPGHADRYADIVMSSIGRIRGFIAGATINAAVQGVAVGIGMVILGIPLPIPIGLVIFFTAFVPYIGAFIGGFFAVAMGVAAGGLTLGFWALVVVILGSGLLQNLLQPVLTGNKLSLHPIIVLLVTLAGGVVAGLVGFILAAPLAAIVRDIYTELKETGYFDEDGQGPVPAIATGDAGSASAPDTDDTTVDLSNDKSTSDKS